MKESISLASIMLQYVYLFVRRAMLGADAELDDGRTISQHVPSMSHHTLRAAPREPISDVISPRGHSVSSLDLLELDTASGQDTGIFVISGL